MNGTRTLLLALAMLPAMLSPTATPADEDHEIARRAVERGEILPLSRILALIERDHPGRVLEVELDREDGRYVYEIEVLRTDGRVIELTYDASTGELLETEIDDD
jgi:uncharacterized membrane protein YkoI